jgi:hypothetical protein
MAIVHFSVGDFLQLKKKHPCSCDLFKVMRGGTDVRIICTNCQRDLTLPREKLEKMIKKVVSRENNNE